MPLCRFRQVIELITQEKREQMQFQAAIVEWQTKHIASMFSVAAREDKQVKAIIKAVRKMNLPLNDEEADIIDTRTPDEIVEQGAKIDFSDQPSFEALEGALNNI